jgi:hypothetical protein
MDRREAMLEHIVRNRLVGPIKPNKRQQQEAAERSTPVADPKFVPRWNEIEVWYTPDGGYYVTTMEDGLLWQTVIWCVRNAVVLHADTDEPSDSSLAPALAAARWLARKPIFRKLVRESIARNFTYPSDIFTFFKAYLLNDADALDDYQPWQDPERISQLEETKTLENLSLQPPEWDLGKPLRAIEIEDE